MITNATSAITTNGDNTQHSPTIACHLPDCIVNRRRAAINHARTRSESTQSVIVAKIRPQSGGIRGIIRMRAPGGTRSCGRYVRFLTTQLALLKRRNSEMHTLSATPKIPESHHGLSVGCSVTTVSRSLTPHSGQRSDGHPCSEYPHEGHVSSADARCATSGLSTRSAMRPVYRQIGGGERASVFICVHRWLLQSFTDGTSVPLRDRCRRFFVPLFTPAPPEPTPWFDRRS